MADPGGIVGLIAGLPGLVTACADLYKLTVAARNFSHDVQMVVYQADVEQWKFAYWLQDVGFVEGVRPKLRLPRAVQPTVVHQLQGIKGVERT
jgi:hypothetical protein